MILLHDIFEITCLHPIKVTACVEDKLSAVLFLRLFREITFLCILFKHHIYLISHE